MRHVKRAYDTSGRRTIAQQRHAAIVRAARDLFERDGFRATTVVAVARQAKVSPETIYKRFGTKAALAKAVFDLVIGGEDEDVPVAQQAQARAIRETDDIARQISLYVEGYTKRIQRSAPVQILIRDGRHVDESLEAVWRQLDEEALGGMGMLARSLAGTGRLRVRVGEAQDILWNLISVDQYERLVMQRGWPLERFKAWLTHALQAALVG